MKAITADPVTDYISKFSEGGETFLPRMFQGFPEIKEALISNKMQAAFIVAPLAIALKAQGVPIKIVYLGHRYGSAVVVHADGPVRTVPDLRGRVVAIPSRVFYDTDAGNHYVRFAFCKQPDVLGEAVRRLAAAS